MLIFGRWARGLGLFLLLACVSAAGAEAATRVTDARIGDYRSKTRFVLDLTGSLDFRIFMLADPYRVVIDLPEVRWELRRGLKTRGGVIEDFRYGLFKPGTARIVLDVKAPVQVIKSFTLPPLGKQPHRLVVDLRRTTRAKFLAELKSQRRQAKPRARARPPVKLRTRRVGKPMIAIDPGHGGVDPGTIGASGTREKRIVLLYARELRRQLKRTGLYRVKMTRDRDVFVRLRDRIDRAREVEADLFISLHADSLANRLVRGASIYTLSEKASDKEAAALASKENKADVIAGVDLNAQSDEVANILIDLAQRETMNESAVFARRLTSELGKTIRLLRNTHRFAGFAVLKAPDIPSVLVELGYLSNRHDEKQLRRRAYRRKIAAAIVRAVNGYFARQQVFKRP